MNSGEFSAGDDTSSCGSARPEFIQRTREPTGLNVVSRGTAANTEPKFLVNFAGVRAECGYPTTNQSSTEPRFPGNQTIRQNSDSITTYDRAPNHDRVVLKLYSTRSEALQVIANLKSEFHTYLHRQVFHISYERTLIDSLQKMYKDNKAERDSCNFWNRWTRERFIEHLELIWPQTVSVADKTFLEAIRDLHVQYNISDATVEQQTFSELMNIHRHYTHRTQEDNDKAIKILLEKINDPEKINWHPRFYETLAECNITLPLVDLVDFRYVLMNTFQGAHTEIANLKSSFRLIISGSPHSRSTDIRRGVKKGGHQSKPAQSFCTVCGEFSHDSKAAKSNPYANLTLSAYVNSVGHAKLVADKGPRSYIPGAAPVVVPPTQTRRRKLSQLLRPSLQRKAGPTRSEVIYLPLRLQQLLTPRLTSCLLLYPYSHRSRQALEWRWMLSWIRAA